MQATGTNFVVDANELTLGVLLDADLLGVACIPGDRREGGADEGRM